MTQDIGPMPDPQIEPKEPNPGGVDAIDGDEFPPTVNELDPDLNPAIEDVSPDEIKQPEKGNDGPRSDGASNPQEEAPA